MAWAYIDLYHLPRILANVVRDGQVRSVDELHLGIHGPTGCRPCAPTPVRQCEHE